MQHHAPLDDLTFKQYVQVDCRSEMHQWHSETLGSFSLPILPIAKINHYLANLV